ncbi:lipid A export permease/ATP-binding protein MsbA [Oleiagrimonas sp. C23AA]|uniref:lipid A export permease/ATP-binding protein MsbA n=1 Tax=Oleiagrimonas sp. C23AA TaxID=2719047 RepID=UPI00141E883B|nr:lipid A export permease/ATP-binding protein MsbA [Oleiagrimonas sp. C23AA]NII10911.1 lipid A export permease/ATP-binding protein MsbA [Oleiagrimonas sp. C23AA]
MSKRTPLDWKATFRVYRRLLSYLKPYRWVGMLTLLAMAMDAAGLTAFTKLIKPMIDDLFVNRDPQTIFWLPIAIIALAVVRGTSSYFSDYGVGYLGRNIVCDLRKDVFESYLRLPVRYFGAEGSGQQISRITYTSDQVAKASTSSVKVLVSDSLLVIGLIYVMLSTSPYLTLALLLMVPTMVAIVTWISRRYRRISRAIQGSMGSVAGTVQEAVHGHREVRIYGGQASEQQRFDEVADRTARQTLKIAKTAALSSAGVQTTAAIALAAIVYLATRPGVIDSISAGTFTQMLLAMTGLLTPLKRLTNVQADIQRGVAAAEDLFATIDEPAETDSGTRDMTRAEGDIRFEHVGMRYPGAQGAVLADIQLHCKPGTVTALVGRSGAGKSSLVSLLPRFYELQDGRIVVDGREHTEYTLAALRRQIGWVGQHVVLFDDTVAANIAYGEMAGASEAEIIAAAEAAHAMEFIRELPEGLTTRVGESGSSLSGGQRQRIAIARAILKNAPILILDEATSALDTESERLIQEALKSLMRDRTTLVIAHRLSTIEHADQIAVMDHGRIVELGSHEQLLARDGHYAALHRMQFHDHPLDGASVESA